MQQGHGLRKRFQTTCRTRLADQCNRGTSPKSGSKRRFEHALRSNATEARAPKAAPNYVLDTSCGPMQQRRELRNRFQTTFRTRLADQCKTDTSSETASKRRFGPMQDGYESGCKRRFGPMQDAHELRAPGGRLQPLPEKVGCPATNRVGTLASLPEKFGSATLPLLPEKSIAKCKSKKPAELFSR